MVKPGQDNIDEIAEVVGLPGDVFGIEEDHDIKYKTLSWKMVAMLMITEIVSNGMLSLPSSFAAVGIVPGVAVVFFLGAFGTYTAWALIQFKLRHPEVHNMGDAGYILFGPLGREILGGGTILFAICATGSQLLAGQLALSTLSNNSVCALGFTGILSLITTIFSFPRTLGNISWISVVAAASIILAGILGMAGAGASSIAPGNIAIAVTSNFTDAFISITNPVFAFAGHFMFFILISEMRRPQDAMKAAWVLQIVATGFYIIFASVTYWYIGAEVQSPSLLSLSPLWAKISFGVALPNFLIAGSLYSHTAAKLVFIRVFRNSHHVHSHTFSGWSLWTLLILIANVAAFVFAAGIPIFNYLVGITASLFAAWYTYGLAGAFWLHDAYHFEGGYSAWSKQPFMFVINVLTILAGGFICVGGLYATIASLIAASDAGELATPFQC
ncbi:transmembrane amino acid transporter [Pseudomassariella vexata]|uniref:Transmembrane amino acid transporter n=1 Tax=Pseudomassariella vexata TaxID=1141098 RepID=A0A1Y2EHG2_9PEZI|nr:transmembrane amino acid transporter [Pseudomassariella vexata]ORY71011.1 transmembrane amino acid transporter [Pseudomassariella vexata]